MILKEILIAYVSILFLLIPVISSAETSTVVSISGYGYYDCTTLSTALTNNESDDAIKYNDRKWVAEAGVYIQWIKGYITAFNIYNKDKLNIKDTDSHLLVNWLLNYCKSNPKAGITTAVNTFIVEKTGFVDVLSIDQKNK